MFYQDILFFMKCVIEVEIQLTTAVVFPTKSKRFF
jgi:hypothetical protein